MEVANQLSFGEMLQIAQLIGIVVAVVLAWASFKSRIGALEKKNAERDQDEIKRDQNLKEMKATIQEVREWQIAQDATNEANKAFHEQFENHSKRVVSALYDINGKSLPINL